MIGTSKPSLISAGEYKRRTNFNQEKVNDFIVAFNDVCERKKSFVPVILINTNMLAVPKLTEAEFYFMKQKADSIGWRLTSYVDDRDTVNYRFEAK